VNSTLLNICKILVFIYIAAGMLNVSFFQLFPIIKLGTVLIHSILVVSLVLLLHTKINFIDIADWLKLSIYAMIYLLLLLITAPLFKLDYFGVIRPILKKYR